MTEQTIQLWLSKYLLHKRGMNLVIPNFKPLVTGEMDVCAIDKHQWIHEFEIKISRQDFRADAKKDKHGIFRLLKQGATERQTNPKHRPHPIFGPNYFSYVVPFGLIESHEVPEYAGLFYVGDKGKIQSVKRVTRIHERTTDLTKLIAISLSHRYWHLTERIQAFVEMERKRAEVKNF